MNNRIGELAEKARAVERARKVISTFSHNAAVTDEAGCARCGRVIYCGASKLCKDPQCGLSVRNKIP